MRSEVCHSPQVGPLQFCTSIEPYLKKGLVEFCGVSDDCVIDILTSDYAPIGYGPNGVAQLLDEVRVPFGNLEGVL